MFPPLLDKFRAASFAIFLRPEAELFLPGYKGAAFRGGFGYVFKSIVCPRHETDCLPARLGQPCIYSEVFETPVPPESSVMRKYPHAPHPFVLTPPLDPGSRFNANQELHLELVLVGRAIPWAAFFICTLEELGRAGVGPRRSRYRIDRVESLAGPNGLRRPHGTVVYQGAERRVVASPQVSEARHFAQAREERDSVTLYFLTPVRIVSSGELTSKLPFVTLFRSLLRRLALLAYFHCGQPADLEAMRQLIKAAESVRLKESSLRWREWERFSTRQQARMKVGGLVGKVRYEGNITQFMPLLRLGEMVHLGKGTSFGLGKYAFYED